MRLSRPKKTDPVVFQKTLLNWYDRNKRDLPWRKIENPYSTFVSEMMLQQTQVKTVIPYYTKFLNELPDWKALSRAREEKVLKLWEGLGYYRRARNLHAAARQVVKNYGGRLPDTLDEILKLPGVGPYSAGAILSIAYQKPHPVVDGNVIRVFSRLFLLRGNLKAGEGHKKVWDIAQSLIPLNRPGDFNQALMELGATVCFSENPQCLICPMLNQCQAAQKGIQTELPETAPALETIEVPMAALLIRQKKKLLVKKRSEEERWLQGLWEFPSREGKTFEEALRSLEKELRVKAKRSELKEVRHQITHHKIRLKLFSAPADESKSVLFPFRWVDSAQLSRLPFSSAQSKLREWAQKSFLQAKTAKTSAIITPAFSKFLTPKRKAK